jgi:hypothetical protein
VYPRAVVAASSPSWWEGPMELVAVFIVLFVAVSVIAWLLVCVANLASGLRAWATKQQLERNALARQAAPVHGFPVVTEPSAMGEAGWPVQDIGRGPGRYRIVGVVAATGTDIRMYVDAETPANAKVKAELKGVIVTEVEKQ